ncbi:MAG: hypothetical protein GC187_10195 [Alphaproteobacteria bacterium]|nr:hypothetical protein [Alphaproteobacteria bacterium]
MIRLTAALAALLAAPVPSALAAADLAASAGETIRFDVFRGDGTPFGTHEVRFTQDGGALIAQVTVRLRAGLGPVTVFRYEHDSTERWEDGRLVAFDGRTLKDGDIFEVAARANGAGLEVTGRDPQGAPVEAAMAADILPSSHWHRYPQGEDRVLNTEHGTLMDTRVEFLGEDMIEADGRTIPARRYRLTASLTLDLWYDENGRWARSEFEARGQRVTYVRRANPVTG